MERTSVGASRSLTLLTCQRAARAGDMSRSNYHGKRGSNAGDDFHELWAIRRALETIEPGSTVQEVTVEGVRALDEAGTEGPEWDGVDCAI